MTAMVAMSVGHGYTGPGGVLRLGLGKCSTGQFGQSNAPLVLVVSVSRQNRVRPPGGTIGARRIRRCRRARRRSHAAAKEPSANSHGLELERGWRRLSPSAPPGTTGGRDLGPLGEYSRRGQAPLR